MIRPLFCILAFLWITSSAGAGEYNSVLDIGDAAPTWDALPATDGKTLAMHQLSKSDVVVLAFTCNSCPYGVDAEDRLIKLHQDYHDRSVSVVAVNVNTIEADAMPAMTQKAEQKKFPFAYLFDESQQIAKAYGAKYTPEFFVINKERKVVYMGSLDDSPDGKKVTRSFVRDAIEATLAGKAIETTETVPIGCRIRLQRERGKSR